MTHIVSPNEFKSKKAFREAVLADPHKVTVSDPSIFNPFGGTVYDVLLHKGEFTVTNHPKRSWFARVWSKNGKIIVE